ISLVFFYVHVPQLERAPVKGGIKAYFAELKEGICYIGGITWLKIMLVYIAFFCICMTPASMLTPLQVVRSFGDDVWRLTAIEIGFAVGMALGGILISAWGGFKNKIHTMILACFTFGSTTLLFGVVTNFWVYLIVMVLCGLSAPFFNTPAQTMMQSKLDPLIMGRVFSVFMMINGLAMPVGMMLFGPLSDVIQIELMLIITGALMLLSGFLLMASKTLNAAGLPDNNVL
ncbi:MFS transporter, partial [Lachnospiraceae bacterium OttesenSCG-928-D06]|nr:MFS transporter [Lachnospiraceae bacterium OttesenSCG-928-D06]